MTQFLVNSLKPFGVVVFAQLFFSRGRVGSHCVVAACQTSAVFTSFHQRWEHPPSAPNDSRPFRPIQSQVEIYEPEFHSMLEGLVKTRCAWLFGGFFQIFPKWWWKVMIYHGNIRKTSPTKQIQVRKKLLLEMRCSTFDAPRVEWREPTNWWVSKTILVFKGVISFRLAC